jgi:prophage regulatory protein
MAHRLIPYSALADKGIDLSKVQLWRLERAGKFPKRVRVTPGRYAWVEEEIDTHLEQKIAERDEKVAKAARTNAASARRSCDG